MTESTAPALWRMLGILAAIIGLAIATCAREHPEPADTDTPESTPNDGPCWPAEVCHA